MPLSRVVSALEEAGVAVQALHRADADFLDTALVEAVQQDSRAVGSGDLFVAWAGAAHDGHDFLGAARDQGAIGAIVEHEVAAIPLPQIAVDNARLAAAVASDFVVGSPWRTMRTVGITGTNGKTTTALLLRSLLGSETPTAAIGTLGVVGPDGAPDPATEGLTTPGPTQLSTWLASLAGAGVSGVVIETSSHALDQYRLDGIRFDAMVFTNLTRDHLDYHGDRNAYLAAKARLLTLAKPGGTAVINADDEAWTGLAPTGPTVTYGMADGSDVRATELRLTSTGSEFDLHAGGASARVQLPLLGRFNVYNALAAAACATTFDVSLSEVAAALARVPQIPGRLERVVARPFDVLIDFAHTPDALDRVLEALAPLVEGRLIAVFGAGGDRDATKRPRMGQAVARHADIAVVTSDNPRTEDPASIVQQVAAGVTGIVSTEIIDRKEAILRALDTAEPGDLVLLAGKGHETYQVVGTEKRPFRERDIVLDHLGTGGSR